MPATATNWADEVDGEEQPQTFTDANGITTTTEYKINEDGKKVKVQKKKIKKYFFFYLNQTFL